MYADMVLVNGKIVTMDSQESTAKAVAVKYGNCNAASTGPPLSIPISVGDTRITPLRYIH